MAEKMRVHILAKELNVSSKTILDKCKAEGLNVKNHMSTLTAGQEATLREWFSEGTHATTVEVADRVNLAKVRLRRKRKKAAEAEMPIGAGEEAVAVAAEAEGVIPAEPVPAPEETLVGNASATTVDEAPPADAMAETPPAEAVEALQPPVGELEPAAIEDERLQPVGEAAKELAEPRPAEVVAEASAQPAEAEAVAGVEAAAPAAPAEPVAPAGPQNIPKPARLRGPRVVRYEAPEVDVYPRSRPRGRRPAEPATPVAEAPAGAADVRGREKREEGRGVTKRRQARRGGGRGSEAGEALHEWRDRDLIERQERLAGATGRRIQTRRIEMKKAQTTRGAPAERRTTAEIEEPIALKHLCAAIGVPFLSVFNVLKRDHNMICNVNSIVRKETAELLAAEFGVELTVREAKTSMDLLREEFEARDRMNLRSRPPVVTMLGHVDHGKTSLLDRIRRAHVAADEDGGITQHIGAYHLQTSAGPVTFVDTPGHQAFTAMRARGARLTDIVVLVVAVDDGVMPQTVEAINHAKAAEVAVVVALTKCDLRSHREIEIYGQLAAHDLTPSGEWGGETDVIRTSAVTGEGIQDLIEHLVALGEVMELKADPTVNASGAVIEAETKEGVGPVVRVLVQEGTLRKGDIVVCGNAAGKVRALHDDRGRMVESAGPSFPVEVWGLEDVPQAGDRLFQVDSMQRAKLIADETAHRRLEEARRETLKVRSLEELFKRRDADEAPELNVIIKADVDGSVDVLRHALGELPSDKIKLSTRHAGVGAVNDSDVSLAEASDAIIIAFRVVTQTGAKRLAESGRVDIRYYRVVYEVIDDIVKAMEGKLAPQEREEPRGTAEVRQVFRVSKVGVVAGCMVTDGIVGRNHRARVSREGAVIREGSALASLRHFKDDVREVRAGMECGIRLEGFDDVKPGDIIETYEIIEVAQTL